MSDTTQNPKQKKAKSLDEEIAATQQKLNMLVAKKRDEERKALERNQKAIAALLRTERLDAIPIGTMDVCAHGVAQAVEGRGAEVRGGRYAIQAAKRRRGIQVSCVAGGARSSLTLYAGCSSPRHHLALGPAKQGAALRLRIVRQAGQFA